MHDSFFVNEASNFDIKKVQINELYAERWVHLCDLARTNPQSYEASIKPYIDAINPESGASILEVGCGFGRLLFELAYNGGNCVGIDASRDAIHLMNQVNTNFRLNMSSIHGDACSLPFENCVFDVVFSDQFFEHVTDIDIAMQEQIRVLRHGGKLIIEQANLLNVLTLYDLLFKYPSRTKGEYGGIKWLLSKGKIKKNIYGTGWTGKDEDIHSNYWWKKNLEKYPNLKINEFTSILVKRKGKIFKYIDTFLGDIFVIVTKI